MKGISSAGGKKWLYFEYVLDVESVGFADRLGVACKKSEGPSLTSHSRTWETEMGKVENEAGFMAE